MLCSHRNPVCCVDTSCPGFKGQIIIFFLNYREETVLFLQLGIGKSVQDKLDVTKNVVLVKLNIQRPKDQKAVKELNDRYCVFLSFLYLKHKAVKAGRW